MQHLIIPPYPSIPEQRSKNYLFGANVWQKRNGFTCSTKSNRLKKLRAVVGMACAALLGGKGAGLADMTRAGVPVPPGFTVTTEACNAYLAEGGKFPAGMWDQELAALKQVEEADRQEIRRSDQSAAGFLPLRRQVLHARHDGHRAEHRLER